MHMTHINKPRQDRRNVYFATRDLLAGLDIGVHARAQLARACLACGLVVFTADHNPLFCTE